MKQYAGYCFNRGAPTRASEAIAVKCFRNTKATRPHQMPTPKETVVALCDECDALVAGTVEGSYDVHVDPPGYSVRFLLLKCPKCSTAILVQQDDEDARYAHDDAEDIERWTNTIRLYPETGERTLGTSVPEPIRTAFAEARACFEKGQAYTACAIMCGKVLEGICEDRKAQGSNLSTKLKYLYESGELDKRLYEWVSELRVVRNEAAHDVKQIVSREDASDLLDFAEAVAEYLYTFKEKFERFQKRRAARKGK